MPADDAPDPAPADPPSTPADDPVPATSPDSSTDPAPAQAAPTPTAEHSPSEPASPPTSDRADAPRPRRRGPDPARRRGPDPARRRAASTGFLLGSLAALLVTAIPIIWRHRSVFEASLNGMIQIAWLAVAGLVLLWMLVAMVRLSRVFTLCVCAALFAGTGLLIVRTLRHWWGIYRATTVPPHHLTTTAAAYLAGGLLAACALHMISAAYRWRTGRAPGSTARRAARRSRPAASGRLPHRLLRAIPAPRALAAGVVGFLVPVLACTGLAVLPSALVRPAISTTAPVPAEIPTRPRAAAGELAWTRLVEKPLDVVAGEAGPVVVQPGAVRGLDPATGAVRWSYERPGAEFTYFAWSDSFFDSRYLITSPNGRYAALRVYVDWRSTLVVVLDTRTGRVTAEHTGSDNSSLQLTDTVALDGARAFSLIDGRDLWTLSDLGDEQQSDLGYTGPAGHSTFIRDVTSTQSQFIGGPSPGMSRPVPWDSLILIPDADPTATTRIDHVLTDPTSTYEQRFAVVDGWTAQLTEDGARAAEASPAVTDRPGAATRAADADPVVLGWQAQAVSLDALAGSAPDGADPAAGALPVPMGVGSGINSGASLASGELCLYGEHPDDVYMNSLNPGDDRLAVVGAVFDPATRSALAPEADPGLASAEVGIETTVQGGNAAGSIVVRPGDGSAGISAPVDGGSIAAPSHLFDAQHLPVQQMHHTLAYRDVAAMAVPGAILLILDIPSTSEPSSSFTRIYAVTGGSQ